MFQTEIVEKIETRILCSKTFSENRAVYEIMCKNVVVSQATDDSINTAHARFMPITKATDTHSD
jgi:hypothetical protein